MAEKLQRVTKANVGPRDNVGGPLNNALVTVQDHNKVVDAVNLLYDNDAAGAMIVTEVVTASGTSTTQAGFANLKVGDIVIGETTTESGNIASVTTAATCPITPVDAKLYVVLRSV
jgi:hypothetical protein